MNKNIILALVVGCMWIVITTPDVHASWNYVSDSGYQRSDGSDYGVVDYCSEKIAYKFLYTGPPEGISKTVGAYLYGSGNVSVNIDIYSWVNDNDPELGNLVATFTSNEIVFNGVSPDTSVFYEFNFGNQTPLVQNNYYWIIFKDVNGAFVSNASAQLFTVKIQDGTVSTDEITLSTSAADTGNLFRYDLENSQYIYNLAINCLSVGSWQLRVVLDDGKNYTVVISLK